MVDENSIAMLGHFLAFWTIFQIQGTFDSSVTLWCRSPTSTAWGPYCSPKVPAQLMAVWFDATATLLDSLQGMDILEDVEGVKIINSERVGLDGFGWCYHHFHAEKISTKRMSECQQNMRKWTRGLRYWTRSQVHPKHSNRKPYISWPLSTGMKHLNTSLHNFNSAFLPHSGKTHSMT